MSTIFRTELKLLLRHWSVWVVGAASILMAYDVGAHYTMSVLPFWIDESFFRFYLLAVMLLTVSASRRAASDRVDELIGAMPYRPAAWVLGRCLANCAVWLLVSLAGWATAAGALLLRGEPVDFVTLAVHWAVAAPVSVAVAVAVGFALGYLPGYGILGYVLALGYFFASVSVPMLVDPHSSGHTWTFLDLIAPQHWLPLTTRGYFPNGVLVLMNRLFDLGLGAAVCAVVLAFLALRRHLPGGRAVVAVAVAVAVSVTGVIGTQRVLAQRSAEAGDEAANSVGSAWAPVSGLLRADHYDLQVAFQPQTHGLDATGSFDVTNTSGQALTQLELTLRSTLQVQQITGPDGISLPCQRHGDGLVVEVPLKPGETVRLTAQWGGEVWQWRESQLMIYWGRALGAHVAPESIFLPATYGWYPLPMRVMQDTELPALPPASFTLKTAGTDLRLITNVGAQAPGLYVIGTSLPTVTRDGVELTVAPVNLTHALQALDELKKRADLLGLTLPDRVIEMPTTTAYGRRHATELAEAPGALLLRSADLADPSGAADFVSIRWWPGSEIGSGLALYMERVLTGKTPFVSGDIPRVVLDTMQTLEEVRGRAAAMTVLRELYGAPTAARFAAAIQSAAQGDSRVVSALAPLLGDGGAKK